MWKSSFRRPTPSRRRPTHALTSTQVIYGLDLFVSLLVAEGFMSLVAACVPHYIIGIALAAGIFGFHMLCEGFFKVKSEIPVCCPSPNFRVDGVE